jgi:hypothetical protein
MMVTTISQYAAKMVTSNGGTLSVRKRINKFGRAQYYTLRRISLLSSKVYSLSRLKWHGTIQVQLGTTGFQLNKELMLALYTAVLSAVIRLDQSTVQRKDLGTITRYRLDTKLTLDQSTVLQALRDNYEVYIGQAITALYSAVLRDNQKV